jgi:hypothetical protein
MNVSRGVIETDCRFPRVVSESPALKLSPFATAWIWSPLSRPDTEPDAL